MITQLLSLLSLPDTRALLLTARCSPGTARATLLVVARQTLRSALFGALRPGLRRRFPPDATPHMVAVGRALLQREQSAVQREKAALAVLALCVHSNTESAPSNRELSLLQLLLSGADPDLAGACTTPLHCAAMHNRSDLAALLLAAGAATELKDDMGRTPLQVAQCGHLASSCAYASYHRLARELPRTLFADLSAAELRQIWNGEIARFGEKAERLKLIADDAQRDLDEVLPALDATVNCLNTLNKVDFDAMSSAAKPFILNYACPRHAKLHSGVRLTMEVVCHMFKLHHETRDDLDNPGKKIYLFPQCLLDDQDTVQRLLDFDKDNIPDSVIDKIEPYMGREDFTPEAIAKTSKACAAICRWCHVMYKYHTIARRIEPKRKLLLEKLALFKETSAMLQGLQGRLGAVEGRIAGLGVRGHELSAAEVEAFRTVQRELHVHAGARSLQLMLQAAMYGSGALVRV